MLLVVDDVVGKDLQDDIEQCLLGSDFFWFYTPNVTSHGLGQKRPSMSHLLYRDGYPSSPFDIGVEQIAAAGLTAAGRQGAVHRAKTILQLPLNQSFSGDEIDHLHVDMSNPFEDHTVVLYYVVDADGDTLITDSLAMNGEMVITKPLTRENIVARVTPKKGRAVIFDGRHYHTAEQPTSGIRCVVNINVR